MAEKKVSWLELFFDLVFVITVSGSTRKFVEIGHHPADLGFYVSEYILMVFPMFWLWIGQTMFFNRYSEHLRAPALLMLPQMFCLLVMTASLDFEFGHTYHSFLISYLGFRLLTVLEYFLVAKGRVGPRLEAAAFLGRLFLPGLVIPFCSLFFSGHWRYVIMYLGIAADIAMPLFFGARLKKAPVNLPHLAERFGLFVLITFGESLVSVVAVLVGHTADSDTLIFAGLCFLIIALMWASYFFAYENKIDHHLETNGQVMLYGHFLILVSVMLLAGDIELLHEHQLENKILLFFLYGPVMLFYLSKGLVFFYHRKRDALYYERELTLVLLVFVPAVIGGFSALGLKANLLLVALICGLEIAVEMGWHWKLKNWRRL